MAGSPQQSLRQGDVLAKKYEVDAFLGNGSTGSSWSARQLSSGKKVAIKLMAGAALEPSTVQPVLQQLKETSDDALVGLIDYGEHEGQLFVVQEYFDGDSLRRLMDEYAGQKKSFSLTEACQIVVRALEAADAAHRKGLVHRHIKPGNIMIQSKSVGPGSGKAVRTVKLTGLGFSALVDPVTLSENLGERADNRYLAPELSVPHAGGTPQADIYSVGVIFYVLLTGQTPMGTYLSPSQIREELTKHVDDIVDIAIDANVDNRYPTARDMINDIQRTFTDDEKPAPTISSKQTMMVVAGSLGVIAVIVGAMFLNDPAAEAKRADQTLRASVVKENPAADRGTIEAKLRGHPNMAYIPAGTFIHGRMRSEDGKVALATEPLAAKEKIGAFYIDVFEHENAKGGHPSVGITWEDAGGACSARGKRLCSATEWERACKGPENTVYSYGDTFTTEACGSDVAVDTDHDGASDWKSGGKEACKSGWGVYDLSGGPAEWTGTSGANGKFKVYKGGKGGQPQSAARCSWSNDQSPTLANRTLSFRCCMDDDGKLPVDPNAAPPVPEIPAPVDGAVPAPPVAPVP